MMSTGALAYTDKISVRFKTSRLTVKINIDNLRVLRKPPTAQRKANRSVLCIRKDSTALMQHLQDSRYNRVVQLTAN